VKPYNKAPNPRIRKIMPNKESIEIEIAKLIVETLCLEGINPSDIDQSRSPAP
jgi:hypothetical protein